MMKSLFNFIIISLILLTGCAKNSLKKQFNDIKKSTIGIRATSPKLENLMLLLTEPNLSKTGKSLLTVNKMGFDILDNKIHRKNWLLIEYLKFIKQNEKEKVILDIGCGYGGISLASLQAKTKVIANDIATEHLIELRRRAITKNLPIENLYLNNKTFPYQLKLKENSLDSVVLYRVLHFLSPEEVEFGLKKIYNWLKPGGKLFIVVLTPQHKSYTKWFMPIYNKRWENGERWPGNNLLTKKALPHQAYNLPEFLHVMDQRPLKRILKKYGFKIEKIAFINMKNFSIKPKERDGRESIGVIAYK